MKSFVLCFLLLLTPKYKREGHSVLILERAIGIRLGVNLLVFVFKY